MNQATPPGAVSLQPGNPDVKEGEVSINVGKSPRDIALQAIEDKQDVARIAQVKKDLEGDPGAAALQNRIVEEQEKNRKEAEDAGLLEPLKDDGAVSVKPMHPERLAAPEALPAEVDPNALPAELKDDPLAAHIVMDGDQPMFALKVNGENLLMPLPEARRRLQIGTAAEIRMQNAATKEKQVDERERKLSAGEQALSVRMQNIPLSSVPTEPRVISGHPPESISTPGLTEETIRSRSRDVMATAFAGTDEDAGDKLSKLLMDIRTPQAALAAPIDEAAIVTRAATAAVSAVTARDYKKDLVTGLETFKTEYPEIMSDVYLYNMADGMTDGIVTEHPEWSKSQIMLEAGKRTSEWVENLKGTSKTDEVIVDTVVTKEDETISEQPQPPETQIRQERKSQLVRIPQAAIATQPAKEPEEKPQTPREALDELRQSRGQPTAGKPTSVT